MLFFAPILQTTFHSLRVYTRKIRNAAVFWFMNENILKWSLLLKDIWIGVDINSVGYFTWKKISKNKEKRLLIVIFFWRKHNKQNEQNETAFWTLDCPIQQQNVTNVLNKSRIERSIGIRIKIVKKLCSLLYSHRFLYCQMNRTCSSRLTFGHNKGYRINYLLCSLSCCDSLQLYASSCINEPVKANAF